MNDIITNKPAQAPRVELFSENDISIRYKFTDGYDMSNLSAKIYRKLDNIIISDVSKQPVTTVIDSIFYINFSSTKLKLLLAPFVLYVYDGDAAIIGQDCVTSNKTGVYNDVITQVVIGDETIIEVNAQLNPSTTWGSIQGDITQQEDLIQYISDNGLSQSQADLLYATIVHTHTFASLTSKPTTLSGYGITDAYPLTGNPSNFLTSINSGNVISALGYTPVSLSGSYTDPSWITSLSKSKVGLSNVLNVAQEPAITGGTTSQYWRGDKTWVTFPTIPTNNNQLTNGSNYITASSTDVLTNKTGNISQWTNNSGYLISASLTGYATETFVSSGYSPLGHTHTFASLTSKPTTIFGYGITDTYTKTEIDGFAFTTASNTQTFTNKSGNISQWTNNSGYITASSSDTLTNKSISYSQLTGTPTIPTNDNYVDLTTNQANIAGNKGLLGTLTIAQGTTTLTPLIFQSGSLNTTPVIGAFEFLVDKYYAVITTSSARKEFAMFDLTLNTNQVPYMGSAGRLIANAGFTFTSVVGGKLSVGTATSTANLNIGATAQSSGNNPLAIFTGVTHTSQTASTELIDVNFNLARSIQFATGAKATQRAMLIQAPTYSAVGASVITDGATFEISGAPTAGTNITITNPYAFRVSSGNSFFNGDIIGSKYRLSALNTAPSSATDTGTLGEIRWASGFVYLCVSTNSWQRSALSSW